MRKEKQILKLSDPTEGHFTAISAPTTLGGDLPSLALAIRFLSKDGKVWDAPAVIANDVEARNLQGHFTARSILALSIFSNLSCA